MFRNYIGLLAILIITVQALYAQTESKVTLTVSKAGTLKTLLTEEQYKKTTSITLTGEVDIRDLKVLQEMSSDQGILHSIDLSKAKVVAYQEETPTPPAPAGTFETLPLPTLAFGATASQIEEYEKVHKGTLNEKNTRSEELHKLLWFDIAEDEALVRCYFVSHDGAGTLDEFWGFYPDIDKAVEIKGESFALTFAFEQLLISSGFLVPTPMGEDGFVTTNKSLQMDLSISLSPLSEITGTESDAKVLVLMYAPAGEYM